MHRPALRHLCLLSAFALLALPLAADVGPDTSLETLLGKHGREQLSRQLEKRVYGGKTYEWSQYSSWGHDLLVYGSVKNPPVGSAPSVRLSDSYRCVHCHNMVREDARLTAQDPEAREVLLRKAGPAAAEKRDGSVPSMVPATTFWGIVNRNRYYNGFFERYRSLKTQEGTPMNPERLTDAIQICSRYCSAGRYPEAWEMDAMVAYLWDLELRMKDLDLTPEQAQRVTAALNAGEPKAVDEARGLLRSAHLTVAGGDPAELPKDLRPGEDIYAGGKTFRGDAGRGELLFKASCGGCHGQDVTKAPPVGRIARRAKDDGNFDRVPRKGTERRGGLYMPLFTAERLSHRQLADIRTYLASLR